jgi:hypothetical protein
MGQACVGGTQSSVTDPALGVTLGFRVLGFRVCCFLHTAAGPPRCAPQEAAAALLAAARCVQASAGACPCLPTKPRRAASAAACPGLHSVAPRPAYGRTGLRQPSIGLAHLATNISRGVMALGRACTARRAAGAPLGAAGRAPPRRSRRCAYGAARAATRRGPRNLMPVRSFSCVLVLRRAQTGTGNTKQPVRGRGPLGVEIRLRVLETAKNVNYIHIDRIEGLSPRVTSSRRTAREHAPAMTTVLA